MFQLRDVLGSGHRPPHIPEPTCSILGCSKSLSLSLSLSFSAYPFNFPMDGGRRDMKFAPILSSLSASSSHSCPGNWSNWLLLKFSFLSDFNRPNLFGSPFIKLCFTSSTSRPVNWQISGGSSRSWFEDKFSRLSDWKRATDGGKPDSRLLERSNSVTPLLAISSTRSSSSDSSRRLEKSRNTISLMADSYYLYSRNWFSSFCRRDGDAFPYKPWMTCWQAMVLHPGYVYTLAKTITHFHSWPFFVLLPRPLTIVPRTFRIMVRTLKFYSRKLSILFRKLYLHVALWRR